MKKLVLAAVTISAFGTPVLAQKQDDSPMAILEKEKQKQAEQLDQQYKRMIDRTRKDETASTRNDPWANMRAPNDGKR